MFDQSYFFNINATDIVVDCFLVKREEEFGWLRELEGLKVKMWKENVSGPRLQRNRSILILKLLKKHFLCMSF